LAPFPPVALLAAVLVVLLVVLLVALAGAEDRVADLAVDAGLADDLVAVLAFLLANGFPPRA
jgi:hypothetical protein